MNPKSSGLLAVFLSVVLAGCEAAVEPLPAEALVSLFPSGAKDPATTTFVPGSDSGDVVASGFQGPDSGFFVGAFLARTEIGGDFDGKSFVSGGGSSEVMPDSDAGSGWGLALGGRGETVSFEIGFERTEADGTWSGIDFDTTLSILEFDFKVHPFFTESRVVPHALFGFGFPRLKVHDGSVASGGRRADATFKGLSGKLGGGLTFFPFESLAVLVEGGYRWMTFSKVDGIVSGDLEDDVDGDGTFFRIGVSWIF